MDLVAFDLETTGLSTFSDRVIEIGAVRFDASGRELDTFECLVDCGHPISPPAFAVHGIRDVDLVGASPPADAARAFLEWLGPPDRAALLAHNAAFDSVFLGRELGRHAIAIPSHSIVDTLCLTRRWMDAPSHQLDRLARTLGIPRPASHRALADSRTVMALWLTLATRVDLRLETLALTCPAALYQIIDPAVTRPSLVPAGCDWLQAAIDSGGSVVIEYHGGTKGAAPRTISPKSVETRGGRAYVLAFCHVDQMDKEFRLDRIGAQPYA